MLNNYVIGTQKLTVFVDSIGLENQSSEIIGHMLKDHKINFRNFPEFVGCDDFDSDLQEFDTIDVDFNEKVSLILVPFAKLSSRYKISAIIELIHKLKQNKNVKQIFGWLTVQKLNNHLLQPFLEYISDTIITLNSENLLTVVVKRSQGVVKTKQYSHEILKKSFVIKEFKSDQKNKNVEPTIDLETLATSFKVGQFKENELEAKKNLQLPFEYHNHPQKQLDPKDVAKIIYTPDLQDDLDEEDPDDDLLV